VVTFPTGTEGGDAASLLDRFRTELSGRPEVVDVTGYSYSFGASWLYINLSDERGQTVLIGEDITRPGYASTAADTGIYFYINWVDPHYIPTLGIELISGRNFSEEFPSDVDGAIVINETAARKFGLDDPVGQKLPRGFQSASIVGVVKDFHFYPLHRKIEPLVLHLSRNANLSSISEIAVRIRPENIPTTLSLLQETWSAVSGGKPFTYEFLDERVAAQYSAEQRWQRIVQYSSLVSVFICCLGLFGLSSLSVSKRIKEVGIRRTLGASESNIVGLICRQFMIIVGVSVVIAGPVAYLVMDNWLDRFAYRTEIGLGIPAVAGCMTLVIALATVSYYAFKAARANPVESLRYE
jgi:putative ABC transport system permease protein